MFGFIADIVTSVISIVLPIFATYKAIQTKDSATLTIWLIYWITLALVLFVESQLYFALRWLPLYSWMRLIGYTYLVVPGQNHGSFYLYREFIHPFLYRYEIHIDRLISGGNSRAFAIAWEILKRGLQLIQDRVTKYNVGMPSLTYESFFSDPRRLVSARSSVQRGEIAAQSGYGEEQRHLEYRHGQANPIKERNAANPLHGPAAYDVMWRRKYENSDAFLNNDQRPHAYDLIPKPDATIGRQEQELRALYSRDRGFISASADAHGWDQYSSHDPVLYVEPVPLSNLFTPPSTPTPPRAEDSSRSNSRNGLSSKKSKSRPSSSGLTSSSSKKSSSKKKSAQHSASPKNSTTNGERLDTDARLAAPLTPESQDTTAQSSTPREHAFVPKTFDNRHQPSAVMLQDRPGMHPYEQRRNASDHLAGYARPTTPTSRRATLDGYSPNTREHYYSSHADPMPYHLRGQVMDIQPAKVSPTYSRRGPIDPAEILISSVRRVPTSPSKQRGGVEMQSEQMGSQAIPSWPSNLRREFDPQRQSERDANGQVPGAHVDGQHDQSLERAERSVQSGTKKESTERSGSPRDSADAKHAKSSRKSKGRRK